jgi:hypothetical protein
MNQTSTRVLRATGTLLALLAVVVYLGYLMVYVVYAVDLFQWPFDYDQGEGFELYDAVLFSKGEWPYRDNAEFPFYASNYPPLFHLMILPLLPIFGPRLIAGRLVSFGATIVTSVAITSIVKRKAKGWFIPAISGLAFLASNYVYQIGPLSRMHMSMVMFETLAVAFIAQFQHPRHGKRNLVLGLLMLLCAGYTKQMAVFTVAAALSYVFIRDIRKALLSGVALAAAAGAIFWLLNSWTDGQWWVNIIEANVNRYDYRQTVFLFGQWFTLHAVLAVLASGYLAFELFWGRLSVYSLWFVFSLGAGALSGKWGAGFGYFTTSVAAICVLSGLALASVHSAVKRRGLASTPVLDSRRIPGPLRPAFSATLNGWRALVARTGVRQVSALLALLIPGAYLLQAPRLLHLPTSGPVFEPLAQLLGVQESAIQADCTTFDYHDTMGYTQLGHLLTEDDYEAGALILDYVRTADGPALSEEAMFSVLSGSPVVTNPTQLLNLYNNDLLDTRELVRSIDEQRFGVVVFRAQFYPPPVLEAIGQNYKPVEHLCMNGFYYHILWPNRVIELGSTAATQ